MCVWGPDRVSFKDASLSGMSLLSGRWGTWSTLGTASFSVTALLRECIRPSPGCSKEPEDVPQPQPRLRATAPCVPSRELSAWAWLPCHPLQATFTTWGGVCTRVFSPSIFTHPQPLLGELPVLLGFASVSAKGLCVAPRTACFLFPQDGHLVISDLVLLQRTTTGNFVIGHSAGLCRVNSYRHVLGQRASVFVIFCTLASKR